jgi:hypothetical protein
MAQRSIRLSKVSDDQLRHLHTHRLSLLLCHQQSDALDGWSSYRPTLWMFRVPRGGLRFRDLSNSIEGVHDGICQHLLEYW